MKNCSQVLEETNKIGLSALLIAIRTGQHDVRSTVTIAIIIIVIVIIMTISNIAIVISSNYKRDKLKTILNARECTKSPQRLETSKPTNMAPRPKIL